MEFWKNTKKLFYEYECPPLTARKSIYKIARDIYSVARATANERQSMQLNVGASISIDSAQLEHQQ